MKIYNLYSINVISVILIIALSGYSTIPSSQNCDKVKISITTTPTSQGGENGIVVVRVEPEVENFKAYLFCGDQKNNRLNIKEREITNIPRGSYSLCIQFNQVCTKRFNVEIK